MGRLLVENDKGYGSPVVAVALFLSVSALVALCAKHGRRPPQKTNAGRSRSPERNTSRNSDNKEIGESGDQFEEEEGGLWQKSIMLGDKCRPPEFSGVIYYDSHGNQLSEMPRSPRATTPFHSFTFPLVQTS